MKKFGSLIAASDLVESRKVFSEYMNLDQVISYAVVDRAIRNDDGVLHWYTDFSGSSNHNYYWYEEPIKKKIHLIPWDLDNAFENLTATNPITLFRTGGERHQMIVNLFLMVTGYLATLCWLR